MRRILQGNVEEGGGEGLEDDSEVLSLVHGDSTVQLIEIGDGRKDMFEERC